MDLRTLLGRLGHVLRRRSLDRSMDEEIRFHIEMETEKYVREGVPRREARRRALVAFGGVERHRERLREGRTAPLVDPLLGDARAALRSVRRDPGFSLLAALTIALGVGATTSVFGAVNGLLIRRIDLPASERLVGVMEDRVGAMSQGADGIRLPWVRYEKYREATADLFVQIAAHRYDPFALRVGDETVMVRGTRVSGNYFTTLGLAPALGRFFDADEGPEAVIAHGLWTTRFGADPSIVGRTVHLNSRSYTVVAVAPASFTGTTVVQPTDVWVPMMEPSLVARGSAEFAGGWVGLFARLRPGVTMGRARTRIAEIARQIPPDEPQTRVRGAHLEPMSGLAGPSRDVVGGFLAMLLILALLVLFIAAGNLAGMLLARASRRRREIAVRLALGAGRLRLIRHLLAETLVLCLGGCVVGVALAVVASRWMATVTSHIVPDVTLDVAPDGTVLSFAVVVTVGTGLVFGLWPALQASSPALLPALKDGEGAGQGARGRAVFVGGQVALSVLLLLVASLFARSLYKGLTVDLGFRTEGMAVATLTLGRHGYDEPGGRAFYEELRSRMKAVPGVEAVGLSTNVLGGGGRYRSDITTPDPVDGAPSRLNASFVTVDPGFLSTAGIDVVAGRGISEQDAAGAKPVVMVTENLADRLWPGTQPLGRRLHVDGSDREVVGVVRDGRFIAASSEPRPFLLLPFAQDYHGRMVVQMRAPGAEEAALRALADEVRALNPDIAVEDPSPLRKIVDLALFPHRFAATLVGLFGLIGLVLAAVGIYGVMAFQVARRTRELGVRRALGATGGDVVRQILAQATRLAGVGCVIGLALGAVLSYVARSFLIEVYPLDPPTFMAVPAALFLVALLAAAYPAMRAARVHPSNALRAE